MTGSLQIKKGMYYVVLNFRDEKGKRKQKWLATELPEKNNKRKAEVMLNQYLATYEGLETLRPTSEMLFSDYMEQWLEKKKGEIEQSTWEGYITRNKHIVEYFGNRKLKLRDLRRLHFIEYYDYQIEQGRIKNNHKNVSNGLSIQTVRKHSLLIKQALDDAVEREIINHNPAKEVSVPNKKEDKKEQVFLDANTANKFLKALEGHRLQPLFFITLYYGLRRSEALGLKWNAIDFDNNKITIQHTVVKNMTIVAKDKTKTQSSRRTYPLLPSIKEVLLKVKEQQDSNRNICKTAYNESDYVFTWEDGRLYHPDYISKAFKKVIAKLDYIPNDMTFHDIRHSCASILYDSGWELKDIQEWLGHSNIETTANIYTHIKEQRKEIMSVSLYNKLVI